MVWKRVRVCTAKNVKTGIMTCGIFPYKPSEISQEVICPSAASTVFTYAPTTSKTKDVPSSFKQIQISLLKLHF